MYEDRFGYLPRRDRLEWYGGRVEPLPTYDDAVAWTEQHAHRDGYLYPQGELERESAEEDGGEEKVGLGGSERPAYIHRLRATHRILIEQDDPADEENLRLGLSAFVVHFVGFLFGHRLQFSDWWLDGRVRLRPFTDLDIGRDLASPLVAAAVESWKGWSETDRTVAINALYTSGRTWVYGWDWERFGMQCRVFDAAYRVARSAHEVPDVAHDERWKAVTDAFELHEHRDLWEKIQAHRTELFHDMLWGDHTPEDARHGTFHLPIFLQQFNTRLWLAILGIDLPYVHTRWTGLDRYVAEPSEIAAV